MVIIILEKVPTSLRGDLTRWLLEPHPGIFIGHVSAMVRDQLWKRCISMKSAGGVFQAWSTNNEQHFQMRSLGTTKRMITEWEGLNLITIPKD